jgi:hypothetical protein
MDIQSVKLDLIHWLTELQDKSALEKLLAFKVQIESGLSDSHRKLLDDRLASWEKDPAKVLEWEDILKEFE